LAQYFPLKEVDFRTFSNIGRERLAFLPGLIILRRCSGASLCAMSRFVYEIKNKDTGVPVFAFFCGGQEQQGDIVEALRSGLEDYACWPAKEVEFIPRIKRLLLKNNAHIACSEESLKSQAQVRHRPIVGSSACLAQKLNHIPRLASTDANVLITGETGTGKELFAQAIHYNSHRKSKPFIAVNCSTLPDQLFENELFGHVKGAYTHASAPQVGLVEEAEGGSLFLDEVDSLTALSQTKLLRLLENGEFRPLGSPKCRKADIRVIAATNADLSALVAGKQFREDLYYRLNVLTLLVPPLRERAEDIPLLVDHFLKRHGACNSTLVRQCSTAALERLMGYSWPGNVRELEGVIQRAVILADGPCLQPEDFDIFVKQGAASPRNLGLAEAKFQAVGEFERTYLVNLLSRSHGNISHAAKAAGKERRTFQRLLKKHGLTGATFRHSP
jgi:DNA-binding NtrC family response regulator